jgi:hypothetical protein
MTKYFATRAEAVLDLKAHGFKELADGMFVKTGFKATIHPNESGGVFVGYDRKA